MTDATMGPTAGAAVSRLASATAAAARRRLPVAVLLLGLVVVWYGAALYLNAPRAAARLDLGGSTWTFAQLADATWSMKRPVVPAPHQIAEDFVDSIFSTRLTSPRNLLYHAAVTLESAALGLGFALALGIGLAVLVVHVAFFDRALLPWIVASQAVPVIATAPMIIVVLGNIGLYGLVPKALIAASTAFFPIVIGMTVGLRSPEPLQLDLLATYGASPLQVFAKLRWPAAVAFLMPALTVAATLSIVGDIVGELPTGAQAGLGARLLVLSYTGKIIMMWSVLVMAAALAMVSVAAVRLAGNRVRARRGGRL